MIEYLLQSFTPISHVRRSLLIVIALGLIVIIFSADVSEFSFLGIQFAESTVILVFGFLNLYYGFALIVKTIMLLMSYLDKENDEITNLTDRIVDRVKQKVKAEKGVPNKDSDLDHLVHTGTKKYFHNKRAASFLFLFIELILPTLVAFFVSYILIFNAL